MTFLIITINVVHYIPIVNRVFESCSLDFQTSQFKACVAKYPDTCSSGPCFFQQGVDSDSNEENDDQRAQKRRWRMVHKFAPENGSD
jgi:hypothetical protein